MKKEVFNIEENTDLLIKSMNALQIELSGFRAEMKEFKKTVEKRIDSLDSRQMQCQINPTSCANARKLEEHIKADAGKTGKITSLIACTLACFNMALTIITMIVRSL